jgi:general secretion pathway protein N
MIARILRIAIAGTLLLQPAAAVIAIAPVATPAAIEPDPEPMQVLPRAERPAVAKDLRPQQLANPLWAIPLKGLALTRERPIFSPSRRPPPPAVANAPVVPPAPRPASPPAEPEKPQLALVGTVASERDGIGIFVETATKNVVRLRTGEAHKGWILRVVQGREATLEKNSELSVLALPPPGSQRAGGILATAASTRAFAGQPSGAAQQPEAPDRTGSTPDSVALRARSR